MAKLYLNVLRAPRTLAWFETSGSAAAGVPMNVVTPAGGAGTCTTRYQVIVAPPWLVAAALSVLPALRARRFVLDRRRARRGADGYCADCGYDLTGNASGRCPECGKVPAVR